MKAEELAQWVIDNRYPKGENDKLSDLEMYHFIINNIQLPTQEVGVSEEFYESFMRELTYTQRITEGDKVRIMPIRFKRTAEEVLGWIKTRINSTPSTPQPERLTHEKVVEVLHNTISMEPSELIAGDHRIKDESITEAATAICSLSTEQAEVSEKEFIDKFTKNIAHKGGVKWDSIEDMRVVIDSAKAALPTQKKEDNLGWESMWSDGLSEKSTPKREDAHERYEKAVVRTLEYTTNKSLSEFEDEILRIAAGLPTAPEEIDMGKLNVRRTIMDGKVIQGAPFDEDLPAQAPEGD